MEESPHPIVSDLVTGHFHEKRGYRAWREHGTSDWLLILTVSGKGRFGHHDSGETETRESDIALLRPGNRHDYGVASGADSWELLWCHFQPRPAWHDWLRWPEEAQGLMLISLTEPIIRRKITNRFIDTHRLATGSLPHRDLFAMNALEEVLLWCGTQNPRSQAPCWDERVQAVIDYIFDHLAETLTPAVLAQSSGLSPSRLVSLFRDEMGLTPRKFLEQQRLLRAQKLLERTSHTISAIAAEVGFDNPFYFTLRFKQHTGFAPTDWRRRSEIAESAANHAVH